ncbi:unnamed protein product [Dovyalis caffra]|uniref:Uncharacterized protein n=1 Tax=Dovyalis caffra TaxID=77055 RepID=A0AAV1R693_9ROSI|nr:unnamed protein product [Dovyalis caffra]
MEASTHNGLPKQPLGNLIMLFVHWDFRYLQQSFGPNMKSSDCSPNYPADDTSWSLGEHLAEAFAVQSAAAFTDLLTEETSHKLTQLRIDLA